MPHLAAGPTPLIIRAAGVNLAGDLRLPRDAKGLVAFAHGSGSSRHSERNIFVAEELGRHQFATLLMDLLTEDEEFVDQRTAHLRFDVGMLAQRVAGVIDWIGLSNPIGELPLGLFGASTGAAAALSASAERPARIGAVVSRGGRPDLAADGLPRVQAPTLLLVGGCDEAVVQLNRDAAARMTCNTVEIEVVPGATHLFEEDGALQIVADSAAAWFERFL
jgi:pimeloyl-ACP methyl ester carboxylesterase